ncbi:MAG: 16S rRNA (cytidine(1402)-2'-O)-methyltransferase [Candidatus Cloacimonetes bacterium]|nr:16S rRNA (cytidine(1402)-2'-O)-methyltransferase [Candidatus Cloacimonadota bacterium]
MEIENKNLELERPAIYVVATPIGDVNDITLRALKVLAAVDLVICEERKVGSRLLKGYDIRQELIEVNEHNEQNVVTELVLKIITENLAVAMISDAGTPLFADPGNKLIPQAYQSGIRIVPVPGASSIMAALMAAGVTTSSFLYYGFLPANRQSRQVAIRQLPNDTDIILLEAPYRLKQVLADLQKHLGSNRQAVLAWKLTYPQEQIIETDLGSLVQIAENLGKGEFVLILRARKRR